MLLVLLIQCLVHLAVLSPRGTLLCCLFEISVVLIYKVPPFCGAGGLIKASQMLDKGSTPETQFQLQLPLDTDLPYAMGFQLLYF